LETWTPIFHNIFLELLSDFRLGGGLIKRSQVLKPFEGLKVKRRTSKNKERRRSELISDLRLGDGIKKGSQVRKFQVPGSVPGCRLKSVEGVGK
jgi:hypothetical protein